MKYIITAILGFVCGYIICDKLYKPSTNDQKGYRLVIESEPVEEISPVKKELSSNSYSKPETIATHGKVPDLVEVTPLEVEPIKDSIKETVVKFEVVDSEDIQEDDIYWWRQPSSFVSNLNAYKISDLEEMSGDAGRGSAHGGWYGIWNYSLKSTDSYANGNKRKLDSAGMKKIAYFDLGEVGEYLSFVSPEKEMLKNAWALPQYKGEQGSLHWFGLQSFITDADWIDLPTAKDFNIQPFTYPDGSTPDPDNWYSAVVRKSIFGDIAIDSMSNSKISDEMAEQLKLETVTEKQSNRADIQGKSGWITVKLMSTDYANPQYLDYHKKELTIFINKHMDAERLDGIHFDNFSDNNCNRVQQSGFGEWSIDYFKKYLKKHCSSRELRDMGIRKLKSFKVREWFLSRPWLKGDPKKSRAYWSSPEWRKEKIYRLYQMSLIEAALKHHGEISETLKTVSKENGRELPVIGNLIPNFPGAALFDGLVDIPCFEWATYKTYGMFNNDNPMGTPPEGRIAWISRLAARVGTTGYSIPSTYVPQDMQGESTTEVHKVMQFDCLANRASYDFGHWYMDGYTPGTTQSASAGIGFLKAARKDLTGREFNAQIGLVWSAWSGLAATLPSPNHTVQEIYADEYVGWGNYLAHSAWQWDVLLSHRLTLEQMKKFKVLIFPATIALSDKQIKLIGSYYKSGGKVIMTGNAGAYYGPEGYLLPRDNNGRALKKALRSSQKALLLEMDTPGRDYLIGDKTIAKRNLDKLLDKLKIKPLIVGEIPETVAVTLNRQSDGSAAVDVVNYDVSLENNTITPTPSFEVRIEKNVLGLTPQNIYYRSAGENNNNKIKLSESEWSFHKETLQLKVPSLPYYCIITIEKE